METAKLYKQCRLEPLLQLETHAIASCPELREGCLPGASGTNSHLLQ